MDHISWVKELGLGSRLKRLSDAFMSEVKAAYTDRGIEFEPRWFPLYSLLIRKKCVTVTSAADELRLTHPHISQLAKELISAGLVTAKADPTDARARSLRLTARGRSLGRQVQPIWSGIRTGVREVLDRSEPSFLESLGKIESALSQSGLRERIGALGRPDAATPFQILEFSPKLAPHFERLNREWIEKHFSIEPHDLAVFARPEAILENGGAILFAELDGKIVGTCALVRDGASFELSKLAVSDEAKGKGLGEALSLEVIRRARALGAECIFLTTNSQLKPALKLYAKLGFEVKRRGPHPENARVNLVLEKKLRS